MRPSILASLSCFFLLLAPASAGTILVNSSADDTNPDNFLTLREAVLISEGTLERSLTLIESTLIAGETGKGLADEIQIQAAVGMIQLEMPLPTITDGNTTISGLGPAGIVIDGGGNRHILRVEHCSFRLENVTLKNFTMNGLELDCEGQPPAGGQVSTVFNFVNCRDGFNGLSIKLEGQDGIQLQILKASFKDLRGNGVEVTSSVGGTYNFAENRFEGIAKTGFLGKFGNGQGNISVVYRANVHEKNQSKESIGAVFETLDHSAELNVSFQDNKFLNNSTGVSTRLSAGSKWSSENNLLEGNAEVGMLLRTKAGESAVEIDLKGELLLNNKTGVMVEAEGKIRLLSELTETRGGSHGWQWFLGVGAEGRWDDDGSRIAGTAEVGVRLVGESGSAVDIFLEHSRLEDNRTAFLGFRIPFSIYLDDVRITHNSSHGLVLIDSHAEVRNSLICRNGIDGVQVHGESDVLISSSILDLNGVFDLRNLSSRPVLAAGNDWGAETTAEMEAAGFPSDIQNIFDQFDSPSSGPVDYSGWISPAVGCSEGVSSDPLEDFYLLSDGSASTAPPPWLDIRSATLTADGGGILELALVQSETLPDLLLQPASFSLLLDADGDLETGVSPGVPPFSAFPELGVDVLARVDIRPGGLLQPVLFVGGEAIEQGVGTGGLLEASAFGSNLALTIPLAPLQEILSELPGQPVLADPVAWKWTAFTSVCPAGGIDVLSQPPGSASNRVVLCPESIDVFPNSAFKAKQDILRFPYLRESLSGFSGYAFSNDTNRDAFLRVQAYQPNGELLDAPLNSSRFSLPIGAQSARLGREYLFGEQPLTDGFASWLEVFSDQAGVAGFFLTGDNALRRQDGAIAFLDPAGRLYFSQVLDGPAVFQGQDAVTHLALANPGGSATLLELRFTPASVLGVGMPVAAQGTNPEVVTREIPAKGFIYETPGTLFGEEGARHGFVEVVVLDGGGVVGFALTEFPEAHTIIGQNAQVLSSERTLYSAQLAAADAVFSNLNLVNTGPESRFVFLSAIGENGELLADDVSLLMAPGSAFSADLGRLFDFSTPQGTPAGVSPPAPVVGSLEVRTDGEDVVGNVLFGAPGTLEFAAALPLGGLEESDFVFSHVANAGGLFTGLAFFNPDRLDPVFIYVEVFSREGLLAGSEVVRLGPQGRISRLLTEIVPGSAGQAGGYVRVSASKKILAQQLFGSNQLTLLSAVEPNR